VGPGETVMPGQVVLTVAGLDHLRVETTDLSEQDVARVGVGQRATVYVEALGVELAGWVVRIASQAGMVGGDVVYTVVVELDERPAGLRWGMSVDVEIASAALAATPVPMAVEAPVAVERRSGGGTVVASGEVVPAREARLGFPVPGRVQTVAVEEGDAAESGQVLMVLETALLEAGVTQAEAALAAAQAEQTLLGAGPRPAEVAAAEAQVEVAEAALAQAAARRDQLVKSGAAEAEVAAARAQLAAAQAEEKAARDAHDQMDRKAEGWVKEAMVLRLRAAEQNRVAAEAQLTQAEKAGEVQVRAARAAVQEAAARRDAAQARLDAVRAGASAEEVAVAEAAVAQAEAGLVAAQAALDQATLWAPFAGTVAALEVSGGETVLPGQVVVGLADLGRLQVETTDLSERDVTQVAVGQEARVNVEGLGVEIEGRVASIAAQATTVGGDVVYTVVIELAEQPAGLRWGMSVEVEITTG
jgi:multidrug efflux pump subunit AcrA (membrane-fusion protein)